MQTMMFRNFILVLVVSCLLSFVVAPAYAMKAGAEATVKGAGGPTGELGKRANLVSYVAGITRAALGVTGIIGVIVVVAGGFIYLTSGGAQEKIKTAQKLLFYGAIGLIIIFGAYTFSDTVIEAVVSQTYGT